MEKQLKEYQSLSGDIIFAFVGYDNCEDFLRIMEIVESDIHSEECDYSGITDMKGYFLKNGIRVDVQYSSMMGNIIIYKGEQTESHMTQVRNWVTMIFEKMEV